VTSAPTWYAAVFGVATGCVTLGNSRPALQSVSEQRALDRLAVSKPHQIPVEFFDVM